MIPVIHETAFVHPLAVITGHVTIGRDVYIGSGAALRGDWGEVIIEDGANVQENCTLHMFPGKLVILRESAHIGHGAVIHGAIVGKNALVGMNAVLMDDVVLGEGCIVGAMSFLKAKMEIPDRKLVAGNPARIIKEVSDEMLAWKTEGTQLYQQLAGECQRTLRPCEPLREVPANRPKPQAGFRPWAEIADKKR